MHSVYKYIILCISFIWIWLQSSNVYGQGLKTVSFDEKLDAEAQRILSGSGRQQKDAEVRKFVDSVLARLDSSKQQLLPAGKQIKGIIRDFNTGEGIPFALVRIPGTSIGNSTELDGTFSFGYTVAGKDSIVISAVGYKNIYRNIDTTVSLLTVEYELSRSENMLREVVVKPSEDPAIALVKKVIRNKPENNPDKYDNYKYELYNKLELDLIRMSKETFSRIPMMKPFAFIFNNVDSLSEDKPFLPVYLTETLSDYYFQRKPKKSKEVIKGSQIKGINNESVTQFLGGMYQQINLYDNFVDVFGKQFVSPVNNNAPFYYRYKIVDTQEAYGHRIILVQFAPKRESENCFVGDFWIVDSLFALQRISMDVSKNANINLINRVSLYQEFAPINDSQWFNIKDKFIADFAVPYGNKKLPGFIGRKTTSYRSVVINDTLVDNFVNNEKIKEDVIIQDKARERGADFWNASRHDSLNKNEKAIYSMIDTLNSMPIFNRTKNWILFLTKGTQDVGPLELGPYWSLYNRNPIEGHRFRFSMGTNPKLFKNIYLNGYLAYGTQDQRFKYKIAGLWLLDRQPRHRLYFSYTSDLDRSVSYYSEAATDNVLSNLIRKEGVPFKLAFVKDWRFEHYKEHYNGFGHELTLIRKEFTPYTPLPATNIFRDENGSVSPNVINTEIGIKVRFAYKERFLEGNYYRVSLGSKYPIVSLRLALGLKNVLNSGYEYQKLTLNVSDNFRIPHLGNITYVAFAGKHFGTLPYPLLEIHPGNDFYYYNPYTFSMMTRFEFLSDTYAGLFFEHNIGGGIFNYMPVLKKVKLRQFWSLKTAIGLLSDANKALNMNKGFEFRTLESVPYVEIGTGIDNIFQLFRIDFVWRVAPAPLSSEPLSKRFGIFGSFRVGF